MSSNHLQSRNRNCVASYLNISLESLIFEKYVWKKGWNFHTRGGGQILLRSKILLLGEWKYKNTLILPWRTERISLISVTCFQTASCSRHTEPEARRWTCESQPRKQFCHYCRAGMEIFCDLEWALLYTVVVEDVGGAGGGVAPGAARYQSRAGAPPAASASGALLLGPGQNVGADVQPLDDSLLHLLLGCWVGEEGRVPTGPPGVVRGSAEGARGFHQLLCSGSFLLTGTEWQH